MSHHPTINYKGCYPSDKIPILKPNECLIFNNETIEQGGSHWVSLWKDDDERRFIYDSFGRDKDEYLPPHLVKRYKKVKDTHQDPEQFILEQNCGARCISWLLTCHKFGAGLVSQFI